MNLRPHRMELPFDGISRKPRTDIGSLLYNATKANELTASRTKHPTISRFLKPNMANQAAARLVNNSVNPNSPTRAFLLFDHEKKSTKIVGAAVVTDDVDLFQKFPDCSRANLFRASLCVTWLGIGGLAEFEVACAMTRDVAQGIDKVAIEPIDSSPLVHAALTRVYGPGTEGMFGTSVAPSVLKPSIIYRTPL